MGGLAEQGSGCDAEAVVERLVTVTSLGRCNGTLDRVVLLRLVLLTDLHERL